SVGWSLLGRKLDELLPNFSRIILAVDPTAPTTLGDALRGRAMEGWWAGTERRHAHGAEDAMGRLGIALNPLNLSDMPEATLEAMSTRVLVLRPAGPAAELAPITAPAGGAGAHRVGLRLAGTPAAALPGVDAPGAGRGSARRGPGHVLSRARS